MAEHVSHDYQVGVLTFHAHAVHAQELGKKGAAMAFDDVLQQRVQIKDQVGKVPLPLNMQSESMNILTE